MKAIQKQDKKGTYIQVGKFKFRHQDFIEGSIDKDIIKGMLVRENGRWYFLQNIRNGSRPLNDNEYPFSFGWSFSVNSLNSLTDGVKLLKKVPKFVTYKKKNPSTGISYRDGSLYKGSELVLLFRRDSYPACCGSLIFNNFSVYNADLLKSFTSKEREEILLLITKISQRNINCILREDNQKLIITFLLSLGFEEINRFRSAHGNENLIMLSYNISNAKSE